GLSCLGKRSVRRGVGTTCQAKENTMDFRIVGPGIRPDFISGPASIPGFPDAFPLLSPRHANPFLVLLPIVLLAISGCRQATTERIQGAEVFRNFHKRFYEHVMGEAPPPPRIMGTPSISFRRARKKSADEN